MALIAEEHSDRGLTESEVRELLSRALSELQLAGKRVLVIIPDGTRTAPMPLMFRALRDVLRPGWLVGRPRTTSGRSHATEGEPHTAEWAPRAAQKRPAAALDFLVALGTHPPMGDEALSELVGERVEAGRVGDSRIFNHCWGTRDAFTTLGTIPTSEVESISQGRLSLNVPVRLNRLILDYDHLLVCGPVFPHEVVGFSGGNKYFFPGIAAEEMIDVTHWLGALMTSMGVIGRADTPVREMIDRAASLIPTPRHCMAMVMQPVSAEGEPLRGLYVGGMEEAWRAAAELSAQLNVVYVERPFRRVLSVIPEMYDDIWTGAKGMYKLEPIVADGGEVIIYAPHITEFSCTHGEIIDEVGYHVRDYFAKQWPSFRDYPWGVLAHATHLRGVGTYEDGVEKPRIRVTLATSIPRERCQQVNLGYRDPDTINPKTWAGREDEGILVVPHAGEVLYRLGER